MSISAVTTRWNTRGGRENTDERAHRLVSEKTELGREKDHIRKALRVNGYPDWMLADSWMSGQCDPGQEEREDVREGGG